MTPTLFDQLRRTTRFARLVHVEICESTQRLAREDDAGDQAVFWADHQTHGRGRQGRRWNDAAAEDLTVTFRVTGLTIANPTLLAAAMPVAVARALGARLPGAEIRIKWPNDLLVEGRKMCGILIDSHGRPGTTHLIGVGINVNRRDFPVDLVDRSVSLAQATATEHDRGAVLLAVAQEIDAAVAAIGVGTTAPLDREFAERLGVLDRLVVVETGAGTLHGIATAVDLTQLELDGRQSVALAHVRHLFPGARQDDRSPPS